METKLLTALLLLLSFSLWISPARAGVIPTLNISRYGTNAEVKVHADPKSEIFLYYGAAGTPSVNLGTTDENGNFSTPLSPSNYSFGCGQTAYVSINWERSAVIPWVLDESGSLCRSLSLSQDNLSLRPGQSATITVSDDDPFSISRVTAPDVATAEIERDKLTITALKTGTTTFTICASGSACLPLVVRVSDDTSLTVGVFFSQTRPVVSVGQSQTVPIVGAGGYFVAANSNPAVASASLSSSSLTIVGLKAGTSNLIVCQTDGRCATLFVTVTGPASAGPVVTMTGCEGGTAYSALTGERCSPTNVSPAAPLSYRFNSFLQVNSTGAEVTELQKRLTGLGFYSGPITGRFGPLTEAAVKKLQRLHGITQAGYVGPATRQILNN